MEDLRTGLAQQYQRWRTSPRGVMWLALLIALAALVLATHGRFLSPTYRGLHLAHQMLEAQAREQGAAQRNAELTEVRDYLQTPAGQELAARAQVQALRPGERVVVVEETPAGPPPPAPELSTRVAAALGRAGDAVVAGVRRPLQTLALWAGRETEPPPAAPVAPEE